MCEREVISKVSQLRNNFRDRRRNFSELLVAEFFWCLVLLWIKRIEFAPLKDRMMDVRVMDVKKHVLYELLLTLSLSSGAYFLVFTVNVLFPSSVCCKASS